MKQATCRIYLIGLILALAVVSGCASRQEAVSSGSDNAPEEIREVLDAQVEAWNRGSVREFMDGYAQTDTLRFASGGSVQRGWQQTLQRYQEAYGDSSAMGRLSFSELETWMLSDEYALVFGRWSLSRSGEYSDVGGLFSLLFERREVGWKIVHDHTSAATASQGEDSPDEG